MVYQAIKKVALSEVQRVNKGDGRPECEKCGATNPAILLVVPIDRAVPIGPGLGGLMSVIRFCRNSPETSRYRVICKNCNQVEKLRTKRKGEKLSRP